MKHFCRIRWISCIVLALTIACGGKHVAQAPPGPPATSQQTTPANKPAQAEQQGSIRSGAPRNKSENSTSDRSARPANPSQPSANSTNSADSQPAQNAAPGEHHISQAEAKELFRSVDEILGFASQETAFPIRREVKRRLISRDEVAAYVQKHMEEDEDAQRLRRSELVLKKFGLLPQDFNLQNFLLALLREQVAGFYDPKAKTVNLLDWIDPEQQKPVLAHELTHALQDQSFGLAKWIKSGIADLEKTKQPTPADIEADEAIASRQAVVEGQAMAVLVDYMLAPTGQTLLNSPQVVEALKNGMLVGTADSIQFRNAPIYLKEALTFPYRYGLDFVTELLTTGGKQRAFSGAFTNPPKTTRQIMEPQTYLSGERLQPLSLPQFSDDFKNYERFDLGAIGEFDVAVLIDQYEGLEMSKRLYPHWRGGYYYAARPKGDESAPLGLLYVSRWSSPAKAGQFAAIYATSLEKRYRHAHEVGEGAEKGRDYTLENLTGKHSWLTEDGPVVIEAAGDTVLVSESLDEETTEKVEGEVMPTAGSNR